MRGFPARPRCARLTAMGISVLVVDQEHTFADALAVRLDAEQELQVVATVRVYSPTSCLIAGRQAGVMLLDADLPGGAANELCEGLSGCDAAPRVIMLSCSAEPDRIVAALRAGAAAWVRKDESLQHLLGVIRGVTQGETWLPRAQTGQVLSLLLSAQDRQAEDDHVLAALTEREREVLVCLASGAGRLEVAQRLQLSPNTVRTHLQNLMGKLGVHSTLEAVALTRSRLGQADGTGLSRRVSQRGGQLGAAADRQLLVGVAQVPFHCVEGHEQRLGDVRVTDPARGHFGDAPLACRQRLRPGQDGPPRPGTGGMQLGHGPLGQPSRAAAAGQVQSRAQRLACRGALVSAP